FDPRLVPHDVIEITAPGDGGRRVRVGLVGVVMDDRTVYRRPPFGGATVTPPNGAAVAEARLLERELHCDCVIPLTHQPLAEDRALARAHPFPLLLGGHEHEVIRERAGGGAWLVKAGADATHALVIDLAWNAVE